MVGVSADTATPHGDPVRRAEIELYLATHGPSTVPDISAGIRARHAVVREIVKGEGFPTTPAPSYRSRKAITYVRASQSVVTRPVSRDESQSEEW